MYILKYKQEPFFGLENQATCIELRLYTYIHVFICCGFGTFFV